MAFQTKSSKFALVEETIEGTAVAPSDGTTFLAHQEGFEVAPSFDELENTELRASIGQSKAVLGFENPSATFSHYLRHSGVEGTPPDIDLPLKAAFGAKSGPDTEVDTVGGSTAGTATARATVVVDTGEGATFERGQALLIKDGTNNYSIRPVFSISSDTLSLGFNLDNAPAAGVNLGRAILYKPANTGHATMTAWDYRSDGAALQVIAGARVTELGVTANAGELINANFSLAGLSFSYNPILIDATNDDLDFDDGGGEENVSVTQKLYKDPHELAEAIEDSMNAATTDNITVTYSDSTGKFTISTDGITLSLLWSSGSNTATTIGAAIGFSTGADDTGATTYTSDNAQDLSAQFTPSFDDANPLVAKDNEVFIGDFADNVCFDASSLSFTLADERATVDSICAQSGRAESIVSERVVTVEVSADLDQYDADKFRRFRENETTEFLFNFGTKSGNNWEAGKSGCLYIPTATITSFALSDADGLVSVDMTLKAFVDSSGNGEVYLNFV